MAAGNPHASPKMRIDDLSVIYFGNDWSAENRTSSHHIAERLAARMPLLYVDSPGLRAPTASRRDLRKLVRKIAKAFRLPQPIGPRMWHISTPQIPFRKLPLVNRLNRMLGHLLVKRAVRRLGFHDLVSWFVVPHPGPLAGSFEEELIVYYCIDDYAALPGVDSAEVTRMDEHLTRRAHQVFVASPSLIEAKKEMNPETRHSPHGVDVEMFGRASDPLYAIEQGAKGLKHPIIGFFGLIEAWIDLDLIASLAKARPQWTFLMIGHLAVDNAVVKNLPNVIFTGPKPYSTLASWARAFDVAIIPYKPTRQVLNSNPLKLREYLATGKPVVGVPIPETLRFRDCVRIASGTEEFLAAIENALESDSPKDAQRRMAAVAGMSWDARVEEILGVVQIRLDTKRK
jgi:glycosyltransferase involved in cell wall biosynthesis